MDFNKIIAGCISGIFFICARELYSMKKELWITKNQLNDKIDSLELQISNMKHNINSNNEFLLLLEEKINPFSSTKKKKNKIEIKYE